MEVIIHTTDGVWEGSTSRRALDKMVEYYSEGVQFNDCLDAPTIKGVDMCVGDEMVEAPSSLVDMLATEFEQDLAAKKAEILQEWKDTAWQRGINGGRSCL